MYVRVYDNGQPALHDTKILTVTVKSNFFAPQFFPRAYERVVLETWNIEDQLFDLNATDSDLLVSIVQTCLRHYLNLPVLNTTCINIGLDLKSEIKYGQICLEHHLLTLARILNPK